MRDFEKISYSQFKVDVCDDLDLYNQYRLPSRDDDGAAGYDFHLIKDIIIKPGEMIKIPTGIKSFFNSNEVLLLVLRSSAGIKYNLRLCNQIGIIDQNYYNNLDNEGDIFAFVKNEGDSIISFKNNDAIVQGIFMEYLTTVSDSKENIETRSDY